MDLRERNRERESNCKLHSHFVLVNATLKIPSRGLDDELTGYIVVKHSRHCKTSFGTSLGFHSLRHNKKGEEICPSINSF